MRGQGLDFAASADVNLLFNVGVNRVGIRALRVRDADFRALLRPMLGGVWCPRADKAWVVDAGDDDGAVAVAIRTSAVRIALALPHGNHTCNENKQEQQPADNPADNSAAASVSSGYSCGRGCCRLVPALVVGFEAGQVYCAVAKVCSRVARRVQV